jgi:hypothetical protein
MVNQDRIENKTTRQENSRKGSETTRDLYGVEHFARIGAKGRKKTKELIERGKAQQEDDERA